MHEQPMQKPGFDEWVHWAQVVIDRLSICAHIYSKPPHPDAQIEDSIRQERQAQVADLMRRLHALLDETETPSDSVDGVDHHYEQVVGGLALLLDETLKKLPELSIDMQKLLQSPWQNKCNGRVAESLFRGPLGNEVEGIGDGRPEHGRLPASLKDLLEREQNGESRGPVTTGESDLPHRRDDLAKRWSAHTRQSYRGSGGRIE